jgi:hypothetical protein
LPAADTAESLADKNEIIHDAPNTSTSALKKSPSKMTAVRKPSTERLRMSRTSSTTRPTPETHNRILLMSNVVWPTALLA